MKNAMKSELFGEVLTGLLVAAAFAVVAPGDAMAQATTGPATGFAGGVSAAQTSLGAPFVTIVSYISYGLGTVMTIAGIAGAKKHADAPANNPLGPVLGRIGAGAAFLAAPTLVGMMQTTGSTVTAGTSAAFTTTAIGF